MHIAYQTYTKFAFSIFHVGMYTTNRIHLGKISFLAVPVLLLDGYMVYSIHSLALLLSKLCLIFIPIVEPII